MIRFFYGLDPDDLTVQKYRELRDELVFLAEIGAVKFTKELTFNG